MTSMYWLEIWIQTNQVVDDVHETMLKGPTRTMPFIFFKYLVHFKFDLSTARSETVQTAFLVSTALLQ
jgi:hypothetical protein